MTSEPAAPHVWLVPTPVGNLGDITVRAVEVLRGCGAVACEDTRRTGALLTHLGISKPLVRLDAHTMHRAAQVLEQHPASPTSATLARRASAIRGRNWCRPR